MPAPRTPISRPDRAIRAPAPLVEIVDAVGLEEEVVAMTVETEVLLLGVTMTVVLG
jgi:hypothetical protein